jgi:outer membrane receptor for ferrienterochelin and colicins
MSRNLLGRLLGAAALLAALTAVLPASALAQTGRITGTVTNQQSAPVYGAQVTVVGTRIGALTNASGQFVLLGVPAGSQELRVGFMGYKDTVLPVRVQAGQATNVAAQLEGQAIELGGIVISASRQVQRVTDAPATITRIDASVIDNTVGNSFAAALKQVVGIDFIQVGMTSVAINARGFNSSFNNRMLMIEDGRLAVLAENGLPVGQLTATSKVDLAGMEVLVGPGSALYGADASNGVLNLQTKDPRRFPGTTLEVAGGSRNYHNVQARHAGVAGSFGYKVTGEYQGADDWENYLEYATAAGAKSEQGIIDWNSSVARGTGALYYYAGENELKVSGGASQTDGVGQTNIGRNQLDGWGYNFLQAQYTAPRFYLNAYRTQSTSGDSYALNRFIPAANAPATRSLSVDSLRKLSDWPSDGQLYAAEAQTNFSLPQLLGTRFVVGAQYRHDVVSSDRQWLTDRLTGNDLTIDQVGVYGQTETPLTPWLQLVLAGRYDKHDNYDAQFSPKAGLVLKPTQDQALRVTYNRAFKSPTVLQTNFFIPDFVTIVPGALGLGVYGNTEGFTNSLGTVIPALVPEENRTWELGYKGVLAQRLFVDVTGFRSTYENFFSPLGGIGGAGTGTRNGQLVTNAAGVPQLIFTYFNLGKAELRGIDAGVSYALSPRYSLNGTVSVADLVSVEGIDFRLANGQPDVAKNRELSSLNAPTTKWTLGARASNVGDFQGGALVRHVNRYLFASGINVGTLPTFTTLDVNLGYKLPVFGNPLLQASVSNLYTCQSSQAASQSDGCGFGKKHLEMINMPEIGTMLFLGVRYHVQ